MCLCYFPTFPSVTVCADLYLWRPESHSHACVCANAGVGIVPDSSTRNIWSRVKVRQREKLLKKRGEEFWK